MEDIPSGDQISSLRKMFSRRPDNERTRLTQSCNVSPVTGAPPQVRRTMALSAYHPYQMRMVEKFYNQAGKNND